MKLASDSTMVALKTTLHEWTTLTDERIDKRFMARNTYMSNFNIAKDLSVHDDRWYTVKKLLYDVMPRNESTYITPIPLGKSYPDDSTSILCNMGFSGYPSEYVQNHPSNYFSYKERAIYDKVFKHLLTDSGEDLSTYVSIDTSLGFPFGKVEDAETYTSVISLAATVAPIITRIVNNITDQRSFSCGSVIQDLFSELKMFFGISVGTRMMASRYSKQIALEDGFQYRHPLEKENRPSKTDYNRYLASAIKLYKNAGYTNQPVSTRRERTIFMFPFIFKYLSFFMQPLLNKMKKKLGTVCAVGNVRYEHIRFSTYAEDFISYAEKEGYEQAFQKYDSLASGQLLNSVIIAADISGMDHSTQEWLQYDLLKNYINPLLPESLRYSHLSKLIPLVTPVREIRSMKPYMNWDPYTDSRPYPFQDTYQNYSGDPSTTLMGLLGGLAAICDMFDMDVEQFLKLNSNSQSPFRVVFYGDDLLIAINDRKFLEKFISSSKFTIGPSVDRSLIPRHLDIIPVGKETGFARTFCGFKYAVESKPNHLKNVLMTDGQKVFCGHMPLSCIEKAVANEGDYTKRSSGTEKKYPNLALHMRQLIYKDNPDNDTVYQLLDDVFQQVFKKNYLDLYPMTQEEENLYKRIPIEMINNPGNLTEVMKIIMLDGDPGQFLAQYGPIADLDDFFLTLSPEFRSDLVDYGKSTNLNVAKNRLFQSLRKRSSDI